MAEELSIQERQEALKLQLAEKLMQTIPDIPDDFHNLTQEEQDKIFSIIDQRTEKIIALLGSPRGRGPARSPRGAPRRNSERFATPQLDVGITKILKKKRLNDED